MFHLYEEKCIFIIFVSIMIFETWRFYFKLYSFDSILYVIFYSIVAIYHYIKYKYNISKCLSLNYTVSNDNYIYR